MNEFSEGKYFQPILYHLNLLGINATFYKNEQNNIVFIKSSEHIIVEDLRADGNEFSTQNGWKITIMSGIKIYCSVVEYSMPNSETSQNTIYLSDFPCSATWKIDRIELANGDTINFEYVDREYYQFVLGDNFSFKYSTASDRLVSNGMPHGETIPFYPFGPGPGHYSVLKRTKVLSKITSKNHIV